MKSKSLFKEGVDYEKIDHPYFKYRLLKGFSAQTYCTGYKIMTRYFSLEKDGTLTVFKGYACDGASGLTFDTASSMRGAFLHDPCYQILRDCLLFKDKDFDENEHDNFRKQADRTARRTWKSDGMLWIRYATWYRCLRIGGSSASTPDFTRHIKGEECDKLY